MMRRRLLYFENIETQNGVNESDLQDAKEGTKSIFYIIGKIVDYFSYFHLFVAGAALGYIIVLQGSSDFVVWFSYYCQIAKGADIFFYLSTFGIFLYIFIFAGVLKISKWLDNVPFALFVFCLVLLGTSLFASTYSIPSSLMISDSIQDSSQAHWYRSSNAYNYIKPVLYDSLRPLTIYRMITLIITAPICAILVYQNRKEAFLKLISMV